MTGVRLVVGSCLVLLGAESPARAENDTWGKYKVLVKKLNHAMYRPAAEATRAYNNGDYKAANEQLRWAIEMTVIGLTEPTPTELTGGTANDQAAAAQIKELRDRVKGLYDAAQGESSHSQRAILYRTAVNDLRNAYLRNADGTANVDTLLDRLGGEAALAAIKADMADSILADKCFVFGTIDRSYVLAVLSAQIDQVLPRRATVVYVMNGTQAIFAQQVATPVVLAPPPMLVVPFAVTNPDAFSKQYNAVLRRASVPYPEAKELAALLATQWGVKAEKQSSGYNPFE